MHIDLIKNDLLGKKNWKLIMDGAGANMCKAVNIDGVAVKATFVSRVCVGGK